MTSFSDISKTNYLDLNVDLAKSTNDLIKQEQALWDEHFKVAIEEAGRLEKVKSAQTQQLMNLIGAGAKLGLAAKKWEETKDWSRLAEYEATGKVKDKKIQKRLDENKKKINELQKETEKGLRPVTGEINNKRSDPNNPNNLTDEQTALAVDYKYSTALAITKSKRISAAYVAKKFPDFSLKVYNDTTNPFKQADGTPDSIAAAVNRGDWDRLKDIQRHYGNVFLNLSQLDDVPDTILREEVYSKMTDFWDKQTMQYKQKVAQNALKIAEKAEFQTFFTCLDGEDKIGCLVGGEDTIGFIQNNEIRNGVKDTAYAWDYAYTALEKGLEGKDLHWSDLEQMIDQEFKSRQTGEKGKLVKINKKRHDQIKGLIRKYSLKEDQENEQNRTIAIKTQIESYIGPNGTFAETVKAGGYVGEKDLLNAVEKIKANLREENIHFTEQDLQPLLNYFTWEDQDDEVLVGQLRRQMLDNPGRKIGNWIPQVNGIKNNELKKKVTEELIAHHAIDKDVLKDFKEDISAILSEKYPSQINSSARNSAQWLTEERNAEEFFKNKYREFTAKPGIVEDPYQAALKATAEAHAEGKFNSRENPEPDIEFKKSLQSVRAHIDSAGVKEVLNQETYWAGEKEAGIVPGLAYKSGEQNDKAVDYYLSLQRYFPTLTWYELMNKRMEVLGIKDKETAGKVKTEAFVIPERKHTDTLTKEEQKILTNDAKASPSRTSRIIMNKENTDWMLDTIQITSNVNHIQNWPGPAILRPNVKLENIPLNRVSDMVMNTNMRVGMYGLTHRSFKTLEEAGVLDYYRDTPFDAETQKELMLHLAKLNANKQNLSTLSGGYKKLMSIPKKTLDEFNALKEDEVLDHPDRDEDLAYEEPSIFNQIDNLIPAAAEVVIKEGYQPTFRESWERTGIHKTIKWLKSLEGPKRQETDEVPTPYTGGGL